MNTQQAFLVAKAVYEIVLNHPEGYPSGHLYAHLMDKMDLPAFESLIALLVEREVLTQKNHLLFAKS